MLKVENVDVWGFEHAIRGMRNPMNSWDKSDSRYDEFIGFYEEHLDAGKTYKIGENDLELMQKLYNAGHPHRKYLRQIMVSMDITAPLYWWKEFDTYKVGTTANSCSTMHSIHKKEFGPDDFSCEYLDNFDEAMFYEWFIDTVGKLNVARKLYLDTGDKIYWWQMIQLLPSSYNQKRTVTMNYENVFNILQYRQGHKLDEWNEFCEKLKDLPYIKEIGIYGE